MDKPLVIVESPTKVKTLKKYLGGKYNVEATVGHIVDLPPKEIGIDVDHGFEPKYEVIPGKGKVVANLRRAASNSTDIYLAPDPDREGEAIAWHTAKILEKKGRVFHRVLFHELTESAIKKAMAEPVALDRHKFDAQQIRRTLDRLVGYQVSPLLWRKVKSGLSAGRVQTVAVRLICERERAIWAFVPEEYWSITAHLQKDGPPTFLAGLRTKDKKKLAVKNGDEAAAIVAALNGLDFFVEKVDKKRVKKNPLPPFTTSKMQQEAINKLRMTAKKTMSVAQSLYEGVELGPGEPVGLITYMRTDSTRIAPEAAHEALAYIGETFGKDYRPDAPRFFRNTKKVQDAHEAIRPTSVYNTPEKVGQFLTPDQLKLYRLIWQRFVASQMQPALLDKTTISITAGPYGFVATGQIMVFPGFTVLYESADDTADKDDSRLPMMDAGDALKRLKIEPKQHFTQPPPRFSEASLVKELEEKGIGRPSTYAAILSTIRDKNYVELVKAYFRPTELGFVVNDILVASFTREFDVTFTAAMEDDLDRVETAQAEPLEILNRFYGHFREALAAAAGEMVNVKGVGLPANMTCPQCGKPVNIKLGKNGPFLACTGYPDCRFTSNYARDEKGQVIAETVELPELEEAEACEKCGKPMAVRQGKFGPFLACTGYPKCKNTKNLNGNGGKAELASSASTGVKCPQEGCTGELVEKKSRQGKIFYSCNRYPDCSFATWDKPVPKPCPVCGSPFLVEKTSKKEGLHLACPNRSCKYKEILGT